VLLALLSKSFHELGTLDGGSCSIMLQRFYHVALLGKTARKENVYSEESNAFDIRPSILDIKVMFHVTNVNMAHLV